MYQQHIKKLKNKITNKKARAVLDTGIGDYVINKGIDFVECHELYQILR